MLPEWLQAVYKNKIQGIISDRIFQWSLLSTLHHCWWFNLKWKTILSLYNTHVPGNIVVSFRHQEDIYVSFTLHISEFVCCLQWKYVITAKAKCNESDTPIPYKRLFINRTNTVIILFWKKRCSCSPKNYPSAPKVNSKRHNEIKI